MSLLRMAFFGFLPLIITLNNNIGVTCKPTPDPPMVFYINEIEDSEESDFYLTPVVRQLKTLKGHLEQSTTLGLLRIYDSFLQQRRANNLERMEKNLTAIKKTYKLLNRIYRLLLNYKCILNQIQKYDLKTNGEFSRKMIERERIFNELKYYLNLTLVEIEDVLDDLGSFKKQTKPLCKLKLVPAISHGDLGTMKTMDNTFVEHIKSFLDIAINLVENRQIVERSYYE